MSLLIKALNKAEEAQAQNAKTEQAQAANNKAQLKVEADVSSKLRAETSGNPVKTASTELELSLSPLGSESSETTINIAKPASSVDAPVTPPVATASTQQPGQHVTAKSAANVFSAKGLAAKTDSARLVMIAGAGLIALLGMGLYFYQFVDSSPPIAVPSRSSEQIAAAPPVVASTENVQSASSELNAASLELAPSAIEPTIPSAFDAAEIKPTVSGKNTRKSAVVNEDDSLIAAEESAVETSPAEDSFADENTANETAPNDNLQADDGSNRLQSSFSVNKVNKKPRKSKNNAAIALESASFSVTKSTPQPSVNPTLMSAYNAYNVGKNSEAQQLYKQVLKQDIRNVDALLGLGAIASRQGRVADANGWYGKVLEVEPRNSIAKTAMLNNNLMSNQSRGNELSQETSLKNMLARQPDDANLHVALGNLYAEQNQWPAAQQAYFEAYSLNKTTDNVYNLAVSLDQMGKPKLALPYYLQALAQATDASSIDKLALQARISAIQ